MRFSPFSRSIFLAVISLSISHPGAFGKSDWIEDDADLKMRSAGAPRSSASSEEGPIDPAMESTPEFKGNGPLKANVSRFDGNAAPRVPRNQNDAGGLGYSPVRAMPIGPPREAKVSQSNFRNWINDTNAPLLAKIQAGGKDRILEVKGQWDDAGHIIHSFGLPYTRINADQITKIPLDNVEAIVVDCGSTIPLDGQRALRAFVSKGGYLVTTDWALDSCLVPCFPGYVEWNGDYTDPGVVDAVVVSRNPELTRNVDSPAYWKLEKRSQFVHQVNANVEVLARSRALVSTDRYQQGILALAFTYGKGRVLHLVGHFDSNSDGAFNNVLPDASPRIVVSLRQALAANFIVSAFSDGGEENDTEKSAQLKPGNDTN